jgi:hypothetical protein
MLAVTGPEVCGVASAVGGSLFGEKRQPYARAMHGDPQSEQDLAEIRAQLAAAEQAGLPLFGLTAQFSGTRSLNGVGRHGDVVNHVTLTHGLSTANRIDVSVMGPLHGRTPGAEWSIDPLAMIACELLNRTCVEFASGAELERGVEDVLRHGFEEGQVRVEGQLWPFRLLREGDHWAALHDLEPDPGGASRAPEGLRETSGSRLSGSGAKSRHQAPPTRVRVTRSRPERSIVTTRIRPPLTPFGSWMRIRPCWARPARRMTT